MSTIKLTSSGLVITKSGLPSCTCCGGCSCAESLDDTYSVEVTGSPTNPSVLTRDSPCVWIGEWNQTPFGMQPLELHCADGIWALHVYFSTVVDPTIIPRTVASGDATLPPGEYDYFGTIA